MDFRDCRGIGKRSDCHDRHPPRPSSLLDSRAGILSRAFRRRPRPPTREFRVLSEGPIRPPRIPSRRSCMKHVRLALAFGVSLAVSGATLAAQTATQNDSSIRAAGRTQSLPLITSRTLKFTTDEASWISLDVSPNGQTIVFDILGDLYTIPIAGGQATRITSGMGWDQQPRYSPDGSKIVFVSDRNGSKNVWIANA